MSDEIGRNTFNPNEIKSRIEQYENELRERQEELEAQKEELTAAVEELIKKNNFLNVTLEQLQERNQELDQLVYRASHDFKSPITSTLGIINLLKLEPVSPILKEYITRIDLAMQQMNDLLKSLSLFTQASLAELYYEKVKIHFLVENTFKGLKYLKGYEKVKLTLEISDELEILVDANLLNEVLKIVLTNAVIFRQEAEPHIIISAVRESDYLVLKIDDNGEGMTDEVLQKAFGLFYRGSEKSKGAGIGLYMAKKIIHRLNGEILIERKKIGIRVIIKIPAIDA